MFTNVGWSELLVLGVIALVVLGPERLPEAARWLASAIRKVREFASNAQQQLKDDYGTDFEEFREPLKQLNDLRGMSPRAMVTKHLLDGDDSLFTGDFGAAAPAGGAAVAGGAGAAGSAGGGTAAEPRRSTRPPATTPPAAGRDADAPGDTAPASGPVWDLDAT
ncbi:Sec-independent protein translocase protein TatB [Dietzia cinnamea]|uniref:Sec-independent protein translocase protein TatB n=3 Tax=Dietziaceae TaxID=85029 RepID=A0A4R3ZVV4_9ACTN|nr:Sec-independent protein translocase protein TatB [Dietzia cinnamea]KZO58768.1 preprotein translocase [Dietzia maris]MBM7229362.1 Sec-independent protein translocase subunit TatB [Dietzia cinnamea]MCT1711349.1 Sec-independent protein translocase protein TatB [Dietzia cinnamea]MCT2030672.1 Sec-independent protein translocase protein TatB [Dietzia cinnamea]MCT2105161.1 Sec-independent protein translocase protein TatB [Dietzia cinnamea]